MDYFVKSHENIETLFSYQDGKEVDPQRFEIIRQYAKDLAAIIISVGGHSTDVLIALGKLRECLMYAISSLVFEKYEKAEREENKKKLACCRERKTIKPKATNAKKAKAR